MWNLILFLLKWLIVGKPKLEQFFFSHDEKVQKLKELSENQKWDIVRVESVDEGYSFVNPPHNNQSQLQEYEVEHLVKTTGIIVYCKQRY